MLLRLSVCNWFLEVLLWWAFGVFLYISLKYSSWSFLYLWLNIFNQFWKTLGDFFYSYCFFLLPPFEIPLICMLVLLSISHVPLEPFSVFWIFFFLCFYLDVFCWYLFNFRKPLWTISNLLLNSTIGFLFQLLYFCLILSHRFQISNKILHL